MTIPGFVHLLHDVAIGLEVRAETFVAPRQNLEGVGGCQRLRNFFRVGMHVAVSIDRQVVHRARAVSRLVLDRRILGVTVDRTRVFFNKL